MPNAWMWMWMRLAGMVWWLLLCRLSIRSSITWAWRLRLNGGCVCVRLGRIYMPTDLNINLLRRHVMLTTYFGSCDCYRHPTVNTHRNSGSSNSHEFMRKNIINCAVLLGVWVLHQCIVSSEMLEDRPQRKRPKKEHQKYVARVRVYDGGKKKCLARWKNSSN